MTDLGAEGQWKVAGRLLSRKTTDNSSSFAAKARGAITAFARGKQWQLALDVLGNWQQVADVPVTVRLQLEEALARGGQWKLLVQLLHEMESQGVALEAHSYTKVSRLKHTATLLQL
jgi:hypothetical protein